MSRGQRPNGSAPMRLRSWAVGLCVAGWPSLGHGSDNGRLGLRYQVIEEGLLVTSVNDGMGAREAGIGPGSVLVSADDHSLVGAPKGLRAHLVGPAGSEVVLGVRAPLSSEVRPVSVVRRLPSAQVPRNMGDRPAEVRAYRRAIRDQSRRKAVAATEAMVASDFGGMVPREAVGASLATAMRRGNRFARDVALVLATDTLEDPYLMQGLARMLLQTGESERAQVLLERRASLVPSDVLLADGATEADVGGGFQARALQVDAAAQMGNRTEASALARSLLRTHRDPVVGALVGMAVAEPTHQWRAVLPPVEPFEVPLLDGSTWRSSELNGKVTVVNFWATWCGPCKRELPELAHLYTERSEEGVQVLAVSTDVGDAEPVRAMADSLALPFAVGQAPELSERFGVGALPAIRVLGPDGALHYSARGFGSGAMEKLDQAIDQALEGGRSGGAPVANVWGPAASQVVLSQFFPVAGAKGLAVSESGIAVGAMGASPTFFGLDGALAGEASVEASRGQPSARLGWLDGLVGADPGRYLVRKWDSDGFSEWLRTIPEPIIDLVTTSTDVWVAGAESLYVFDSAGAFLHQEAVALTDLVVSDDGVVGVGPDAVIRGRVVRPSLPEDPPAELATTEAEAPLVVEGEDRSTPSAPAPVVQIVQNAPARLASRISSQGDLAGDVARYMVSGRFGPGGERRVAIVRSDDQLVVLDDDGTVHLVAELRGGGPMVAVDTNGDGVDALFVTIPDYGVARLDFRSP
ncbi:MAG: hypothetical protein CL927_02735 [Deltaproteobacteria bacterium]|nr:hypothetical protein [Deltaproteobacteria bacterium]HCH65995.1 hypothetical protein [Deltaproteobacteria bacterium]